jgi:hypothetical protein
VKSGRISCSSRPLVTFESYQTDYVKAAHRLGIPVIFIPFSWDNLTNKGLMRVLPDSRAGLERHSAAGGNRAARMRLRPRDRHRCGALRRFFCAEAVDVARRVLRLVRPRSLETDGPLSGLVTAYWPERDGVDTPLGRLVSRRRGRGHPRLRHPRAAAPGAPRVVDLR